MDDKNRSKREEWRNRSSSEAWRAHSSLTGAGVCTFKKSHCTHGTVSVSIPAELIFVEAAICPSAPSSHHGFRIAKHTQQVRNSLHGDAIICSDVTVKDCRAEVRREVERHFPKNGAAIWLNLNTTTLFQISSSRQCRTCHYWFFLKESSEGLKKCFSRIIIIFKYSAKPKILYNTGGQTLLTPKPDTHLPR